MSSARLLVMFGGRSSEHDVSIRSATEVLANVDRKRWTPVLLGIARDGAWYTGPSEGGLPNVFERGQPVRDLHALKPQVAFPVLHGPFGEDGAMQGLLEVLDIPYVGSGVLASATCMDKAVQKYLISTAAAEVPLVPWLEVWRHEVDEAEAMGELSERVAEELGYPCFVKPANMGSSVGVSAVRRAEDLQSALRRAAQFDPRLVVERGLDAREVEVAVLGNGDARTIVSQPGEIELPNGQWYDYATKYEADTASTRVPAELPEATTRQVRELALHAFRVMGCTGLARIDFLLERQSLVPYLNELNTLPGFTSISMYPKLMEHVGIPYPELITRLCDLALDRHAQRRRLRSNR